MAQRTRRQETTETSQQVLDKIKEQVQQIQRMQLTPQQVEQLRQIIQSLQQVAPPAQATTPPPPSQTQAPAPRRVQQFVYDVTVSGNTYRLTLGDRLPTNADGSVNVAAARRRLNDALLHNEPAPLGGHMSASVQMQGNSQEAARFNAGPENQRMDIFHDRYLGQTHRMGPNGQDQYVENNAVTIAQVQGQRPRGG
jgi:hypothetical protein